ncbi:MAG: hypothetical protein A4E53_04082 [Pelotomaculum sp. PtaB.Bin104]|nr:MAG: hypothetical protein A4E53_04082 [Pelotomaculum sp. PtaB.Bin104]
MELKKSSRFIGCYVPDQDGKLRHMLNLTEVNINLPVSSSYIYKGLLPNSGSSWYKQVWLWLRSNFI